MFFSNYVCVRTRLLLIVNNEEEDNLPITLVEIAWTFYMLHGNMQANFLQNMENSGSLHGNNL